MHLLKLYQAYGRVKDLDEARQDFLSGKDFSISKVGSPYISIRDFTSEPKKEVKGYDGVILLAHVARRVIHCVVTLDEMLEYTS